MSVKNNRVKDYKYRHAALVSVSALALTSNPTSLRAQTIQTSCIDDFEVGIHSACSMGSLRINPDGTLIPGSCIITLQNPTPAKCTVSVTGGVPTQNVIVSVTQNTITLNNGGFQVTIDSFRLQDTGKTPVATKITYTPAQITSPVNVNIGGRLNFSNGQAEGKYSGNLNVKAVFN